MHGKRFRGYMSLREAGEALGYSKQGVIKLIAKSELTPVFYVDTAYLIPDNAIDAFQGIREERACISGIRDGRFK